MPRKLSYVLAGAAAVLLAGPAGAATLTVSAAPNSSVATQTCDSPVGLLSGATTQTIARTCSRADVGLATGFATAAVGHLGAASLSASHSESLGAGIGAQADFFDVVTFTSTDPLATETDVSLNLLLHGILNKAGGFDAAAVEVFTVLGGQFTKLAMGNDADGFTVDRNDFSTFGVLGPATDAVLTTPTLHVFLNSPMVFRLDLQVSSSAGGPADAAGADFGGSFKLPATGVFNLADGVTANAGDYLVDNHFIDPLAGPGTSVPEPTPWALMIAGFGLAGAALRRRLQWLA
jgi:hypothetical protein